MSTPDDVSGERNRRRPRINAKPISMWPGRGWKSRLDRIAGLPLRRQPCGPSIQSIEVRCPNELQLSFRSIGAAPVLSEKVIRSGLAS
jgi:hypothetical protein